VTEDLKLGSGFHTFGLEWTETEYRFFVDGELTWTATPVSNRPQYIILAPKCMTRAGRVRYPERRATPALDRSKTKMVVDYVRSTSAARARTETVTYFAGMVLLHWSSSRSAMR